MKHAVNDRQTEAEKNPCSGNTPGIPAAKKLPVIVGAILAGAMALGTTGCNPRPGMTAKYGPRAVSLAQALGAAADNREAYEATPVEKRAWMAQVGNVTVVVGKYVLDVVEPHVSWDARVIWEDDLVNAAILASDAEGWTPTQNGGRDIETGMARFELRKRNGKLTVDVMSARDGHTKTDPGVPFGETYYRSYAEFLGRLRTEKPTQAYNFGRSPMTELSGKERALVQSLYERVEKAMRAADADADGVVTYREIQDLAIRSAMEKNK